MNTLDKRLSALDAAVLKSLRRGIEKESLRVGPDGRLADTPHPRALGSALTHPHITTDYSEAQLELITGVHTDPASCAAELADIHRYVYRNIGDEMLWCASMPCGLPEEDDIPIGQYGSSNIGRAKTIYRMGLAHRYGRRMQTISGVHYNFSLPDAAWPSLMHADGAVAAERDFRDSAYFSLIRNFRRHSWLLLYLFGASPAVCSTFVAGRKHRLQELKSGMLYLPGATSLRMGPLGYQSEVQASLAVSFNCFESYASSLNHALSAPYPTYDAIGIREGDRYKQLATTLLQIENEFYSTIRPKRPVRPGERPLRALSERGVEYVEVRCMDLDPFCSIGIEVPTMRFLDVFLLHCLLSDSPRDAPAEIAGLSRNQHRVADRGREPGLRLERRGGEIGLADWGRELMREYAPIADALDAAHGSRAHRDAVAAASAAVEDSSLTPSARVLREMAEAHNNSCNRFALAYSASYREAALAQPFPPETEARYRRMAEDSIAEQRAVEAADDIPFETWRQRYIAQNLLAREPVAGKA